MKHSESEQYVVNGAKMRCSCGSIEAKLHVPEDRSCYLREERAANSRDVTPDCNLIFGNCTEGGDCYVARKMHWQDVKDNFVIDDYPAVLKVASWTMCEAGGLIRFSDSGQVTGEEETDNQEWESVGDDSVDLLGLEG